jgi:uncharacterized protein YcgI (DUF1989 family)
MQRIRKYHIPARTGLGFELARGESLRVIDTEGGQVADLVTFCRDDTGEWLSNGLSFHYNETIFLTEGHVLYSNRSQEMLTIVDDQVGRHDFLFSPCSEEMYERQYGLAGHENCLDNLAQAFERYGIRPGMIPTAFNVFMNVEVSASGGLEIRLPLSGAGDAVTFRAEMDLAVGVSACSGKRCNSGGTTSIDVEIISP